MNRLPPAILVLSIIGIIFAALGILGSLVAGLVLVTPMLTDPALEGLRHDPIYLTVSTIALLFSTLVTILLLAASLASLKLRPWARPAMLTYALLSLFQNLFGTLFTIFYTLPHMSLSATASPAARAGYIGGLVGAAFGFLVNAAWCLCILFFFTRPATIDAFNPALTPIANPTPFPIEPPNAPSEPSP